MPRVPKRKADATEDSLESTSAPAKDKKLGVIIEHCKSWYDTFVQRIFIVKKKQGEKLFKISIFYVQFFLSAEERSRLVPQRLRRH